MNAGTRENESYSFSPKLRTFEVKGKWNIDSCQFQGLFIPNPVKIVCENLFSGSFVKVDPKISLAGSPSLSSGRFSRNNVSVEKVSLCLCVDCGPGLGTSWIAWKMMDRMGSGESCKAQLLLNDISSLILPTFDRKMDAWIKKVERTCKSWKLTYR